MMISPSAPPPTPGSGRTVGDTSAGRRRRWCHAGSRPEHMLPEHDVRKNKAARTRAGGQQVAVCCCFCHFFYPKGAASTRFPLEQVPSASVDSLTTRRTMGETSTHPKHDRNGSDADSAGVDVASNAASHPPHRAFIASSCPFRTFNVFIAAKTDMQT